MPAQAPFSVVREILAEDISMDVHEVMARAKKHGLDKSDSELRRVVHKTRSWMKAKAKEKGTTAVAPVAARHTASPKPETKSSPASRPEALATESPATAAGIDLASVFANVTRVNKVVSACGGIEKAREVVEALQACGGISAFLQHLELIAGIQSADKG